jgi:hypothetical protein
MNSGDELGTRCDHEGCRCNQVFGALHCLAHIEAWEIQDVARALREGERLDARGMRIDAVVLQELLRELEDDDGLPLLPAANFRGATFTGDANFRSATFGSVNFGEATFAGSAGFGGVTFSAAADFGKARFERDAFFAGAGFDGAASFTEATFAGRAEFGQVRIAGHGYFTGATFAGDANFAEATLLGDAYFGAATFRRARRLGPLAVAGRLVLDDCLFAERVSIEVAAAAVSGQATTFAAGAHLRVCRAEIALDNADFARPSTLSGSTTMRLGSGHDAGGDDPRPQPLPRLVSLRGAHVAALALSDLDLAACRFFGAHGLESLSIEANCVWLHGPSERRSREMLAEEHLWRAGDKSSDLRPLQIAALYRALRKAREDGKDEAGASDLYFGEMEMRRHGAAKRSDRLVLTLYYLISGYGLRAGRALGTLLLAVLAASLGLWEWGFEDAPSYTRALFVAVESTSSLLRTPDTHGLEATYAGEVIQIVLRLLGPLLLGLALLAVRARVRR